MGNTPTVPPSVKRLIKTFGKFLPAYQSSDYKETEVRREFIDPLFTALGWDVVNEAGAGPATKDVVHEYTLTNPTEKRMPDYSFRNGGEAKFFVEAKKPSVDLAGAVAPALQIRTYGWSAKLPVSVLTDFEELAVYDCRHQPELTDSALAGRLKYFNWTEFDERWCDLWGLLSREAVLAGSLAEIAPEDMRDVVSVDSAFLDEIEAWRSMLAKEIAEGNPSLSQRQLNYAVQQTIDRLILLRIAEDRGIEDFGQLRSIARLDDWGGTGYEVYEDLCKLFLKADDRYNSGLFHFKREKDRTESPDSFTLELRVPDEVLKRIIRRLYFPESPYRFSVFPPDILGQVYEQFLGRVIRLREKGIAVVEEKPEVKKAGGVYYTPTYIVRYIVQGTLGRVLGSSTRRQIAGETRTKHPLRIVDPACGSGSFLLETYQVLLNWYLDQYVKDDAERWAKSNPARLYQGPDKEWLLTVSERKRILLRHIYGVDVDPQAVEVTKLSLLLKVLEGETRETLLQQMQLIQERALPDLGDNIKCGNSLIGTDFYGGQLRIIEPEEQQRINAFDWEREFEEVFAQGGFQIVIGNPPYRRELDYKSLMDEIAGTAFGKRFRAPRMDLWYYFIHRGLQILHAGGQLSFIVNAYWISGTGAKKLITTLRTETHIEEVFFLGKLSVFKKVAGQHMILRIRKSDSPEATVVKLVKPDQQRTAEPFVVGSAPLEVFNKDAEQLFQGEKIDLLPPADDLIRKIEVHSPLEKHGRVRQGIAENPPAVNKKTNEKFGNCWTVGEGVFTLTKEELAKLSVPLEERRLLRRYHDLQDLGRYWMAKKPSLWLIYSTKKTCPQMSKFPTLEAHLSRFRPIMEERRETQRGSNKWWHLHWPRDEDLWQRNKIIAIQMAARPSFVPAWNPTYVSFSTNVFVPNENVHESLYYLTALLNSRVLWVWFQRRAKRRGIGLEINGNVLSRAPIRLIDFQSTSEKRIHDRVSDLAKRLTTLNAEVREAELPSDAEQFSRQVASIEDEIDGYFFDLYELDADERAAVLAATVAPLVAEDWKGR